MFTGLVKISPQANNAKYNNIDRVVIMGSSNLNDRSQCGDRDSEIALLVEDQETIPSRMNGRYVRKKNFFFCIKLKVQLVLGK